MGKDLWATNWDDFNEPGRQDRIKDEKRVRASKAAERAVPPPEFNYPAFEHPEFDPEDIGFTERKTAPIDFSGIAKTAKQRQATTGIEPSADFISGIAQPMLAEKTRESVALTELDMERKREEEAFGFEKYKFGRTEKFAEYGESKSTAYDKYKFDLEGALKKEDQRIAEIQARNSKQKDDGWCIIVTACYGEDSKEVNITRRFRDEFLNNETLRGYYMIAEKMVPKMKENEPYKQEVKENLVNHLVEVGKYRLRMSDEKPKERSFIITDGFLNLCSLMGMTVDSFTRTNGEVV